MLEDLFGLEGEVAVVTGAGRGIGEGIAKTLAGAGAKVVCAARRTHEIECVAGEINESGGQAIAVTTDVTDEAAVEALVQAALKEWGKLNIWVNNAGGSPLQAPYYLLNDIGLDGAIDYKNDDVGVKLDELAPDGVDVYFDNVGGELLDTVLDRIATGARVVICGAISQYQNLGDVREPKLYLRLAERDATMGGFTVDHYPQTFTSASAELAGWMAQGTSCFDGYAAFRSRTVLLSRSV